MYKRQDGARRDAVVIEQLLRLPGIFAGDLVHFLEHAQGTQRDVFQIADGRGHKVKGGTRGMGRLLRGGRRLGRLLARVPHARSLPPRSPNLDGSSAVVLGYAHLFLENAPRDRQ